jgi:hypothetical protein
MFVRDIAPELAKDRDFQITRERPGQLIFSDGAAGSGMDAPLARNRRRASRLTAVAGHYPRTRDETARGRPPGTSGLARCLLRPFS